MHFVINILSNYIVKVGMISWIVAQMIKLFLYYLINRKITFERLFGAGGMPSSHSALVCSTSVAVYKQCGPNSPIFALSLIFAGIVMYDAMGVRRAAGEQAKVINKIIINPIINPIKKEPEHINNIDNINNVDNIDNVDNSNKDNFENIAIQTLKEFLGHTPLEVLGGAALGVVIGVIF